MSVACKTDFMSMREAVKRSLALLSRRDRRRLALATLIQIAASFLDLLGVLLLGLVGALAVTTVQGQQTPEVVTRVVAHLGLAELTNVQLLVLFSCAAAVALLLKTLLSALVLRRVFRFLAGRQAVVSAQLARSLLSKPLTFVQSRPSQDTAYALIQGSGAATMGVLGQWVIMVSESSLLLILAIALFVVNPIIALSSVAFFALVALALHYSLGKWASVAGRGIYEADVASLDSVQEVVNAYREVSIADRRSFYVDRLERLRWDSARAASDYQFIGAVPKYVFEVAFVAGGFCLAGFLFATQPMAAAVGTLTLFLAAATRVMPSILRVQGAAVSLRNSSGMATATFELAVDLADQQERWSAKTTSSFSSADSPIQSGALVPEVELREVSFTYPGSTSPAIQEVSLQIAEGTSVAFVGTSGAGKSTLADLMLGILEPDVGEVFVGGVAPCRATCTWSGSIGYVPQDVVLSNATIRENVALGIPHGAIDDERVWEALERAHIADLLQGEREGLDTRVGERGVRLSGGQRQRLGIARALYTRPRLLVLDEATSALDAETELALSQTFIDLEGSVTTVIIAHRLSTVRHADTVVYMDGGRIVATGSFDAVCNQVPAFRRQAEAMGLRHGTATQFDEG